MVLGDKLKQAWDIVRHDPETLFELRQLLFGFVIVIGVSYAVYSLFVEKKEKQLVKLSAVEENLKSTLADGSLEMLVQGQLQKLIKEKKQLEANNILLRFKEKLFLEQYVMLNGDEQFSNAIFTLLPRSPVDIESDFLQMNVMDKRSLDYFDVHPVALKGQAGFSEFFSYLQYLEERPEVGSISSVRLEQLPVASFVDPVRIEFNLVLGRVELR